MYMQFAGTNIPLSKQVRNFGTTRAQMVASLGSTTANDLLSKSLFLVAIGTNDMAAFAATHQQTDVAAFYSSLISNYSAAITVWIFYLLLLDYIIFCLTTDIYIYMITLFVRLAVVGS